MNLLCDDLALSTFKDTFGFYKLLVKLWQDNIADKVYPFFENWYNMNPECEYLAHNDKGNKFEEWNYLNTYFKPLFDNLGVKEKYAPHHTRHTCISMLKDAKVEETTIKIIVGHKGAMSLTKKVYTHVDMSILLEAINKI